MGGESSFLMFENSTGWILLAILIGSIYSILLYLKVKNPWSIRIQRILAAIRYLAVFSIVLLLIGPYLKLITNDFESPIIVIAIDDSSSVKEVLDSAELTGVRDGITGLISTLEEEDNLIEVSTVSGESEIGSALNFNYSQSDINSMLKSIENNYEGMNLGAVVLVSDGIYNNGISPTFRSYSYPIYTVGVGDTTVKKDLLIKSLRYNKISYQGSQFPLIAEISSQGYNGVRANVTARKGQEIIDTKTIEINSDSYTQNIEFTINADVEGLQRITVEVQRLSEEFSYSNNISSAYVDVIEGKEQILIVSPFPHPDIKAISSAIETNNNYTVDVFIPGIGNWNKYSGENYDLIILNQIPEYNRVSSQYVSRLDTANTSVLYIVGSKTNIRSFNSINGVLRIQSSGGKPDNVSAVYNPSFSSYGISEVLKERSRLWPPISVPFGNYTMTGLSDILLNQRLSNIVIPKPLVVLGEKSGNKRGIITGEGIWKWRLDEYSRFENNTAFNELILKMVQYLSTRQDKRQFRTYPEKNEYLENEPVFIITEVYDNIYNRVYGNEIELQLSNDSTILESYNFIASENSNGYKIEGLDEGIYSFKAQTIIDNQTVTNTGQFAIQSMDVETLNLTADFRLLKELSSNSGGQFYKLESYESLVSEIEANKPPNIIHSSEQLLPLVNIIWILFLLVLLVSSEWFIRKYEGGY